MTVEYFQAFQKQRQQPGNWHYPAGEGRGEGEAAEVEGAAGEEGADFFGTDAAGLRVGGVEPEVVPRPKISL